MTNVERLIAAEESRALMAWDVESVTLPKSSLEEVERLRALTGKWWDAVNQRLLDGTPD